MKRYLVLMICLTAALVYGCGDIFTTPEQPSVQVEVKDNNGDVNVEVDVIDTNDNSPVNDDDCGTCGDNGDGWNGKCYSVPSCTEVPCETCLIFGGFRECQTGACTVE